MSDPSTSHEWPCSGHDHVPEIFEEPGDSLFGESGSAMGENTSNAEEAIVLQPSTMAVDPLDVPTPNRPTTMSLPVQVENITASKLHLYQPAVHTEFSVCRLWKCGSPAMPTGSASFYNSFDTIPLNPSSFNSQYQPCGNCFGSRLLHRYGWSTVIPTKTVLLGTEPPKPKDEDSDTLDESSAAGSSSSDSD